MPAYNRNTFRAGTSSFMGTQRQPRTDGGFQAPTPPTPNIGIQTPTSVAPRTDSQGNTITKTPTGINISAPPPVQTNTGLLALQPNDVTKLPTWQSLMSGTPNASISGLGGPITAPELGINTPLPSWMDRASTYWRSNPYDQQQMLDMWHTLTGTPPELIMASLRGQAPWIRANQWRSLGIA